MAADRAALGRNDVPGRGIAILAFSVVLFATTWPVMKLALADATPLWMAMVRLWVGTATAFALLVVLGQLRLPGRADVPMVLSIAVLQLAGFFALCNLGLSRVPAGRSAVLAYTTALWLLPLSVRYLGERLTIGRGLGALAGIGGVAVLFNPLSFPWHDAEALFGNACLLLAALSWALAIFHARRHVWRLSPLQLLPWQMAVGALLGSALVPLAEPHGHIDATPRLIACMAWIGLVSGPIGTWSSVAASRALPIMVTSLGFLMVPLLGVALSAWWLGEALGPELLGGGALILLGLVLVSAG